MFSILIFPNYFLSIMLTNGHNKPHMFVLGFVSNIDSPFLISHIYFVPLVHFVIGIKQPFILEILLTTL